MTINKATADETHLNIPKVTKLRGKRSKFIIGLASVFAIVKYIPVIRSVIVPLEKDNPEVIWEIIYKV